MSNTPAPKKTKIDWDQVGKVVVVTAVVAMAGSAIYYQTKRTQLHGNYVRDMNAKNDWYHQTLIDLIKSGDVKVHALDKL